MHAAISDTDTVSVNTHMDIYVEGDGRDFILNSNLLHVPSGIWTPVL